MSNYFIPFTEDDYSISFSAGLLTRLSISTDQARRRVEQGKLSGAWKTDVISKRAQRVTGSPEPPKYSVELGYPSHKKTRDNNYPQSPKVGDNKDPDDLIVP